MVVALRARDGEALERLHRDVDLAVGDLHLLVARVHGQEAVLVRWLQEQGLEAGSMDTDYGDEAANDGPSDQQVP